MRTGAHSVGFSLLEMLVVLVLIASATLLAMGAFGNGMRGAKLQAAAKETAAQLRFTRAVAISSGRAQDFVLQPKQRRWHAANGRSGTLPEVGELVFTGAHALQAQPDQGVVRFFPNGSASGGRVRFAANGGGWDVNVAWLTGEVRLQRIQAAQ